MCTAPPLCLDPNPHLTRIANHVLRISKPIVPTSLKRKAALITPEEDESETDAEFDNGIQEGTETSEGKNPTFWLTAVPTKYFIEPFLWLICASGTTSKKPQVELEIKPMLRISCVFQAIK